MNGFGYAIAGSSVLRPDRVRSIRYPLSVSYNDRRVNCGQKMVASNFK
jgi:hypothetical protein